MDAAYLRKRLEHSGHALASLLEKSDDAEASWKPDPDRWSLVEIVNHLADEEAGDFRTRLLSLAEDPARAFPPIDPFGPVDRHEYAGRDYAESVAAWKRERGATLDWLARRGPIDPAVRYAGPNADRLPLSAGDLMFSWIAHDYFHIRQITRLRWDYLAATSDPYSPEYAGTE